MGGWGVDKSLVLMAAVAWSKNEDCFSSEVCPAPRFPFLFCLLLVGLGLTMS